MSPALLRLPLIALLATACAGAQGPCADVGDIPADCAVDDEGNPLEEVCQVTGGGGFPTATITCGRSELRYLSQLCAADPDLVTEDVVDRISCFVEEPDTGA